MLSYKISFSLRQALKCFGWSTSAKLSFFATFNEIWSSCNANGNISQWSVTVTVRIYSDSRRKRICFQMDFVPIFQTIAISLGVIQKQQNVVFPFPTRFRFPSVGIVFLLPVTLQHSFWLSVHSRRCKNFFQYLFSCKIISFHVKDAFTWLDVLKVFDESVYHAKNQKILNAVTNDVFFSKSMNSESPIFMEAC